MAALSALAVMVVAPAPPALADPIGDPLYELVDAVAQRLQTADPVAASKWLTGGAITDAGRVEQVLATVSADAESAGVPADYVVRQFTNQIDATESIQYSRFAQWKLNPVSAPASAPDLSSSRTLIDGLNHQMVSEIAGQWALLRSPECAAQLGVAKTEVAAERGLDPMYRDALDAATRSYCS